MYWWENNFLKVKRNTLLLGGQSATMLVEKHGTPLFVYNLEQVQANCRLLTKILRDNTFLDTYIYYAMKANSHPRILKTLRAEGTRIEAVSPGEVAIARNTGFPASKIFFTGTSLSVEDFQKVFCHSGVIINIDAEEQLELMQEARDKWFPQKSFQVCLRINPGIRKPVKFGIERNQALPVLAKASEMGFTPVGLHMHLGSGWTGGDYSTVPAAVDSLVGAATEAQDHGFHMEFLDFGGGFGPKYAEAQEIFPVQEYIRHINDKIMQSKLKLKSLLLEPGKFLVADAGVLLFKVEYLKKNYGNLFACVNAGTFNSAPRPAVYANAYHQIVHCGKVKSEDSQEITIAGNLCETSDIFGEKVHLPVPQRGDILAFLHAGAYCRSMASHYNTRDIPKEVFI